MRVVQKYGGSSLRDLDLVRMVADRVHQSVQSGQQVVVVVSAMGDTTDEILQQANRVQSGQASGNLDFLVMTGEMQSAALMAMELTRIGCSAQAVMGWQAGIRTNREFGQARVLDVNPEFVEALLRDGITPVITGFQGVSADGFLTTLGRGGSDLTAIALASALRADSCEIYSDVAGVFTADPRVVPQAKVLDALSYEEMMELASQGAQVLQTQAVMYARESGVTVNARSTFEQQKGTRIETLERDTPHAVTAVALDTQVTKIGLVGVPDRPGVAARACERLAEAGINIDLVFQALSHKHDRADIALTVADRDRAQAVDVCRYTLNDLGGSQLVVDGDIAKISAIGAGMRNHAGVAATVFRSLADVGINIQMISTSEIKISCIVARDDAQRAMNQIHDAFGLDS